MRRYFGLRFIGPMGTNLLKLAQNAPKTESAHAAKQTGNQPETGMSRYGALRLLAPVFWFPVSGGFRFGGSYRHSARARDRGIPQVSGNLRKPETG
jgi:hypothetical protein